MYGFSRRLAARTLPPVTIRELRLALQDEWAAMPQQLIDTLILSMGRYCETCLARGMCQLRCCPRHLTDRGNLVVKVSNGGCAEPDEIGNVFEDAVDLARKISLKVYSDDVQELLDSYYQEVIVDELIEMLKQEQDIVDVESLDPVQSEEPMTVGHFTEGFGLFEKGKICSNKKKKVKETVHMNCDEVNDGKNLVPTDRLVTNVSYCDVNSGDEVTFGD
ncbi:hypothetical protein TNCV_3891681 [Trichonephila clavipes]|nr:hypothetical protein TNCV_3891681 [Trichonephila clavipes]